MVRLRLVESFLIHDFDMQCRAHYAPRDSKCHKVEQVMSYLTDAAGDGRHIWPEKNSLLESLGNDELINMSVEEHKLNEQELLKKTAHKCALKVVGKYEGKPALNTVIHAKVPVTSNPYQHFYFDEFYLKKCIDASKKLIPECVGYAYFQFLLSKFDEIYITYDNGVEGLRKDGPRELCRIPPPVPNLETENDKGEWHYHHPSTLPEEYKNVENRQVDDFCPRAQLQSLVLSLGPVNLREIKSGGSFKVIDENKVWERLNDELPEFIGQYCGKDLEDNVRKEAEKLYLRQLQRQKTKCSKKTKQKIINDFKSILHTNSMKITIKKNEQMPKAIPWNGNFSGKEFTNTCSADNGLYFFHALLSSKQNVLEEVASSELECLKTLYKIHKEFEKGKFSEGKHIWFSQFEEFNSGNHLWDAFGSEDQFFFIRLRELTSTTYRSVCENDSGRCRVPVKLLQARTISYSYPQAGAHSFEEGIKLWLMNEGQTVCQETIDDSTNVTCGSARQYSESFFLNGSPPLVLPVEISDCPWTKLPPQMQINGKIYHMALLTFGNGGHFVSQINVTGQWYSYDGL